MRRRSYQEQVDRFVEEKAESGESRRLLVVVSFALLATVCGFKPMRDSQVVPRRRFILWESGLTSNRPRSPLQNQKEKNKVLLSSTILASLALIPEATKAARGAFEMDAEVYLRSLIGQRPNAVFQRSIFPSPRTINKDFAESVLRILLETVSEISGQSPTSIQRAVEANLPYSIKYFQTFLPIKDKNSLQDQYYFDIYLYNCYVEIAKLIPKSDDRVGLQKQFGRKLLHLIYTDYLHDTNSEKMSKISSRIDLSLRRLLNVFFETGMIGGFRLADEKLRDEEELNAFASDEVILASISLHI